MAGTISVDEMKGVVEGLNREPFSMRLSLVAFHKKTPLELLQVVNDVFSVLDPKHRRDLRDEPTDATAQRMLEFLTIINYAIDDDLAAFKDALLRGTSTVIYPLLSWVLQRVPELTKRAYLARFLRDLNVPEEFFADAALVGLFQKHKELQAEFKEAHKQVDKIRGSTLNPGSMQKELEQLESEREQIIAKLAKIREKVRLDPLYSHVDFDDILAKTHALRKEQEEADKLHRASEEQKHGLYKSEQDLKQASLKFKELESSDFVRQEPMKLLTRLREDVKAARIMVDEKLEKEVRDKEKQARELSHALASDPMSEDAVNDLEDEVNMLTKQVEDYTRQRDDMHASQDGKIGFYRDRAAAAEKKKQAVLDQLVELEEEKKEAEEDLKRVNAELKQLLAGGEKPKTEGQMKKYIAELTKKTNLYKAYKADLQYEKDEVQVLQRTEEILRSRDTDLAGFQEQLEKDRGVAGATATQDGLEDLSQLKGMLDTKKAATLDEMSKIVNSMMNSLKTRKSKLAPQIKELRLIRTRYEEVEGDYSRQKKVHDAFYTSIQGERGKLEQDVASNVTAIMEEESQYHFINCLSLIDNIRRDQATMETKYVAGEEKFTVEFKCYKDMYDKAILEQETLAKSLRGEQKTIKETHEDDVGQRQMFLNLRRLLQCKLKTNKEQKERKRAEQLEAERENILKIGAEFAELTGADGGVDRMVIGGDEPPMSFSAT